MSEEGQWDQDREHFRLCIHLLMTSWMRIMQALAPTSWMKRFCTFLDLQEHAPESQTVLPRCSRDPPDTQSLKCLPDIA